MQVARSELDSAIAAVQRAQTDLEQAYIRAPLAGQIIKIHARPGEKLDAEGIADLGQTDRMMLDIHPGEIIIMTGPSGSGKTTLLTLMGGLRSAKEGSLKILGQEICGANKKQLTHLRRNIGYIFQAHNLMTFLTAKENVRMSLELHDRYFPEDLDDKATAMLEAVGLEHRVDYYPENLSGGQRQRVAIARALASNPKSFSPTNPPPPWTKNPAAMSSN